MNSENNNINLQLAKAGYHAYGQTTDFKNYQELPMPKWEDLPEGIVKAWVAAAGAIRTEAQKVASKKFLRALTEEILDGANMTDEELQKSLAEIGINDNFGSEV